MNNYDRGSLILLETDIKKAIPFGEDVNYSPTSVKITVLSPTDQVLIDAVTMDEAGVGQYYYNLQTTAAWVHGTYSVKIELTDPAGSDITLDEVFGLTVS